ncbi:hypothetical protein LCGC14_2239300 [marine sediment metagenome]|uniref:Uncharacterized protein n=1 Tax=marine sediment metagenome TaxID=412755 RepID=A0A0F9G0Z6_9ZZZZ
MSKGDDNVKRAFNQYICKFAQDLYGEDFECLEGSCPLCPDDCPQIMMEQAVCRAMDVIGNIVRDFRER